MKRYNVVCKKIYKNKYKEDKAQWMNVGSLVCFPATGERDEGFALELNMFPDTKFFVFPQKPKNEEGRDDLGHETAEIRADENKEIAF